MNKQAFSITKPTSTKWHDRLGHPSYRIVQQVIQKFRLPCSNNSSNESICDSCQRAKSHQLPYERSTSVSNSPLELVFSDVWGPTPNSVGRYNYYVSFIADFSKFSWIYLLNKKSDVFQVFQNFQNLVERKFNKKILAMQTDWGGEYEKLHPFFTKIGIEHHVSCPHAHKQNGSAERKHRHIVEVGLALLANACMPLKFWDEAFLTATHLINMLPSKTIDHDTPMQRLLEETPDYSSLRVFGCACWPNLRPYNQRKLAFRSKKCVFLGYSPLHKGVKCLDVNFGRIYISRIVVFDEQVFPFASLHPNAGAQLRKEILLLPPSLHPTYEGVHNRDHLPIVPVTDVLQVAAKKLHGENCLQNQSLVHEISDSSADKTGNDGTKSAPDHVPDSPAGHSTRTERVTSTSPVDPATLDNYSAWIPSAPSARVQLPRQAGSPDPGSSVADAPVLHPMPAPRT